MLKDILTDLNIPIQLGDKTFTDMESLTQELENYPEGEYIELVFGKDEHPEGVQIREAIRMPSTELNDPKMYKIMVKPFMTMEPTKQFNFHLRWNNGIPMPLQVMVGRKIRETSGTVYMELQSVDGSKRWSGWVVKSAIIKCEQVED